LLLCFTALSTPPEKSTMSTVSLHPLSTPNFIEQLELAFARDDGNATSKVCEADNVRRLQDHYRAIARGDFGPVIAGMADDIDYEMIGPPDIPLVGRWRGRQQVAEAVRQNFGMLEEQQAELLDVVAQGDMVVLFAREQGRFRATGKPYDFHWVQLFTFRDGKVARFRGVFDSAALLEAVRPG
jgi:uncharacterized protein